MNINLIVRYAVIALVCAVGGCDAPHLESPFAISESSTPHISSMSGDGSVRPESLATWLSLSEAHMSQAAKGAQALSRLGASFDNLRNSAKERNLTLAKVELGRQLFFDPRLSRDGRLACSHCHVVGSDFTFHITPGGEEHGRDIQPVYNRVGSTRQFWDGRAATLEEQVRVPIEHHHEMDTTPEACVERLRGIKGYRLQFDRIYGRLDFAAMCDAIASFERMLITGPSPWDDARLIKEFEIRDEEKLTDSEKAELHAARERAETNPLTAEAARGATLFFSERFACSKCHGGWNFTDEAFHNLGVGMLDAKPDLGCGAITGLAEDRGRFKTPTLRNLARTAPYFHNRSAKTLREALDYILRGGHRVVGNELEPVEANEQERRELTAFLESLTGELPLVETGQLPQ